MKNLKTALMAGTMLLAGFAVANARGKDYNRIGFSYDYTNYSFNNSLKLYEETDIDGVPSHGFGINYIHGFSLSSTLPIYIETGLNVNFDWASKTTFEEVLDLGEFSPTLKGHKVVAYDKILGRNINFQIPINFAYRFNVDRDFSITPYIGLNFKLHVNTELKEKEAIEIHNIPDKLLELAGIDRNDLFRETEWTDVYSEKEMGHKDLTWNRFQMGWHIGLGFQYKPIYLGFQFGTDFIPAYKNTVLEKTDTPVTFKINTMNLKVSLAYTF